LEKKLLTNILVIHKEFKKKRNVKEEQKEIPER
jgi:hypothetical protein